jgi:hypothetical protein
VSPLPLANAAHDLIRYRGPAHPIIQSRRDRGIDMSIGKVQDFEETIGMIRARRVSTLSACALTAVIALLLGWRMALLFVAIAWIIRVEMNRVAAALWPQSYHAMRLTMDEHGFELDGEPQIYRKS